MKRKHIKHLLLFINNTVMTQENGRIYNIHVHCERRKEKGTMKRKKTSPPLHKQYSYDTREW